MKLNLTKDLQVISPFGVRDRKSAKNKITPTLFNKGKQICFWCKGAVTLGKGKDYHATADHVYSKNDIRRALDGSIVLCCWYCNQKKNDKETHTNNRIYNELLFNSFSKYFELEFMSSGNLKIEGTYIDYFFDDIPLLSLIKLATIK